VLFIKLSKQCIFFKLLRFCDYESTAIRCKLYDIMPVSGQWCSAATELFNTLKAKIPGKLNELEFEKKINL
jgi:hypothetical protein